MLQHCFSLQEAVHLSWYLSCRSLFIRLCDTYLPLSMNLLFRLFLAHSVHLEPDCEWMSAHIWQRVHLLHQTLTSFLPLNTILLDKLKIDCHLKEIDIWTCLSCTREFDFSRPFRHQAEGLFCGFCKDHILSLCQSVLKCIFRWPIIPVFVFMFIIISASCPILTSCQQPLRIKLAVLAGFSSLSVEWTVRMN